LNIGASIRTGDQSRAVVLLADETQIKINSNSELTLRRFVKPAACWCASRRLQPSRIKAP
jgi:hypothetical protein